MPKRVGIADVAAATGVSPTTVSHALNGKGRMPADTRERIQATANALGYRPHAQARGLASGRTFTVAIEIAGGQPGEVVPGLAYYIDLLNGAAAAAIEAQYALVVVPPGLPQTTAESLPIDGAIVVDPTGDELLLGRSDVASVTTGRARRGPTHPSVDNDQAAASRMILDHFTAIGCSRPALLTPPSGNSYVADVVASYEAWCAERGATALIERVDSSAIETATVPAALRLLDRPDRPDAVYVTLEPMAIGVLQAARQLGISVPDGLAVAAISDSPLLRAAEPPVTAVDLHVPEIGRRAVELLIRQLDEPDQTQRDVTVGASLIPRASTARTPAC